MEIEGTLPHSQQPGNSSCPEPDKSNPYLCATSWKSILILSTHLFLGLPNSSLPQVSKPKLYTQLYSPTYTPHAPTIFFFFIISVYAFMLMCFNSTHYCLHIISSHLIRLYSCIFFVVFSLSLPFRPAELLVSSLCPKQSIIQ
jgi:hypothetical protein